MSGSYRFAPVKLPKQSQLAAERIADAVRDGAFAEGDRLPSERDLAEQLAISRPTVRDAVRLLADAGMLVVRPGAAGGIFVASEIAPLAHLAPEPALRPGEMIEVLEARRLLLPRVARMAALYAGDDDLERMRAAIRFGRAGIERVVLAESQQRVSLASLRFDLAMAQATRNQLLLRMTKMLLTWLAPLRLLALRDAADMETAMRQLEETLAAIESGADRAVETVMNMRMQVLERIWEEVSGRPVRRRRPSFLDAAARPVFKRAAR